MAWLGFVAVVVVGGGVLLLAVVVVGGGFGVVIFSRQHFSYLLLVSYDSKIYDLATRKYFLVGFAQSTS
jgi:hypothetical protein